LYCCVACLPSIFQPYRRGQLGAAAGAARCLLAPVRWEAGARPQQPNGLQEFGPLRITVPLGQYQRSPEGRECVALGGGGGGGA